MSQVKASQLTSRGTKDIPEPRPSSSIILVSPLNQVLLLHRVKTSTSFASAHVFPGGNLDAFHEGEVAPAGSAERHADGPAYRLSAIRECFEESGILLARKGKGGPLLDVPSDVRESARRDVHVNKVRFVDWLSSIGGEPDVEGLIPFTRWITPPGVPKRFTTQMYLYLLPLSLPDGAAAVRQEAIVPVPDGGVEHTAATFGDASAWLERARTGKLLLMPPQCYLLTLLARFMPGIGQGAAPSTAALQAQRDGLLAFLDRVPTADSARAQAHPTSRIPWREKVISPQSLLMRKGDGRVVLSLEKPGLELKGSDRGGDWEKVVLVKFTKAGPLHVEVRDREEVLAEERVHSNAEKENRSAQKL